MRARRGLRLLETPPIARRQDRSSRARGSLLPLIRSLQNMAQKIHCGTRIRFDAESYYADPRRYERVLCRARDTKEPLLCGCVYPPRRLVVRQINNQHWLAVWPNDRDNHDPGCKVRRHGEGESLTSLARSFGQAKLEDVGILLQDVLPRLWSRAGLQGPRVGPNLPPATKSRLDLATPLWSLMRDRLMHAASSVAYRGQALSVQLHVAEARRRGASPLDLDGRLILAPVHSVMATPYGWRVRLHFIEEPVFVQAARVAGSSSLADWCTLLSDPDAVGPTTAIALLEVHRTKGSNLTVDAGAVYACLPTGQLTAWHAVGALGELLLAEQRDFGLAPILDVPPGQEPSREDLLAGARLDLPAFVLTDSCQPALGLFLLDKGMSQEERDGTARGVLDWLAAGGGAWLWDLETNELPPPLPQRARGAQSSPQAGGVPAVVNSFAPRLGPRATPGAKDAALAQPATAA